MEQHSSTHDFADFVEQEIDFIGQLYVEYEQMTRYEDILTAPDQIRSLASLFYDFVNRIFMLRESSETASLPENFSLEPAHSGEVASELFFLSRNTLSVLGPFLDFYREYPSTYPARIDPDTVRMLYHLFPEATREVAADLRQVARTLRGENHAG
jgi:hypothetical protein